MKVLIIDDARAVRAVIGRFLGELGFATDQAEDGAKALDAVRTRGPFDVCMVDWNMPVMDGLQFVTAVRANPEWAAMKLVMCTTETEFERISQALAAGADDFVMKPFTKDDIQSKLAGLGLCDPP
jgi:two-component system chemotaxis response regulator CheY